MQLQLQFTAIPGSLIVITVVEHFFFVFVDQLLRAITRYLTRRRVNQFDLVSTGG